MAGTLMSPGYVTFEVITEPLGWTVKRKYADFHWLRSVLQAHFPGYYVSDSADPTRTGKVENEHNDHNIDGETCQYAKALFTVDIAFSDIATKPCAANVPERAVNRPVRKDEKGTHRTQATIKPKKLDSLSEQPSLTGSLTCSTSHTTDHFQSITDFLSQSEALKQKLKVQAENIISATKSLSKDIEIFAEALHSLALLEDTITSTNRASWIYNSFAMAAAEWSRCEEELALVYEEHLSWFWKYRYVEMREAKELVKERESHLSAYLKAVDRANQRKDRPQGGSPRLGIGSSVIRGLASLKTVSFSKPPSNELEVLQTVRDEYGYFNYLTRSELRRVVETSQELEAKCIVELGTNVEHFLQRMALEWRALGSKISG